MKRKNLLIILFGIFTYFLLMTNIQADPKYYKCRYKGINESVNARFTIRLAKGGSTIVDEAIISGSAIDESSNEEDIQNWTDSVGGTSFTGASYYDKHKTCPPYVLISLSDSIFWWDDFNVYVADDSSLESLKLYIKDEFSTLKEGYPKVLAYTTDSEEPQKDEPTSCLDFMDDEATCKSNKYFSCVWNKTKDGGYCNTDNLTYVQCGDAFDIPSQVPSMIHFGVNLLKIGTPIVLIIVGMITLLKALTASKEDEITKAKNSLVKKIITAVIIFFVVAIVQFVISLAVNDETEGKNFSACLDCFLNNDCGKNTYYKTNVYSQEICTYIDGTPLDCGIK